MIDLAVFMPNLAGGGAPRAMVSLANAFCAEGRSVDIVCTSASGPTLSLINPAVGVVDLRTRMRGAVPPMVRYLRARRPSSLLIGYDHHCILPILAARMSRVPMRVVPTVHTHLSWWLASDGRGALLKRVAVANVFPLATAIVSVSESVANDLQTWSPRMAVKVAVAPNPLLPPNVDDLGREPVDHPWLREKEGPVVVSAGRLTGPKDWPTLIRAMAILRQATPARLIIIGEGGQRSSLLSLAEALGIGPYLSLPGWVQNPFPYMARADVLAHSSALEGAPSILVEALGVGTPVVATDCPGGTRDILQDGRWGRLVPVGDAEAMASAIAAALARGADPMARSYVMGRYSVAASVSAYARLLFGG